MKRQIALVALVALALAGFGAAVAAYQTAAGATVGALADGSWTIP